MSTSAIFEDLTTSDDPERLFRIRVRGTSWSHMALRSVPYPFDETYEIQAVHAYPAIEKLVHEVEWGILDGDTEFTIEVQPVEEVQADV